MNLARPIGCFLLFQGLLVTCATSPQVERGPLTPSAKAVSAEGATPPEKKRGFWEGRTDLIRSPGSRPAQPLSLPSLSRFKLASGLSVLLMPDHDLPLVAVQLLLPVGSIADPATRVGLADFTASMLRLGTRSMDADTLSETIDSSGAVLGASSGYEVSTISCSGRANVLDLCLRMVADLTFRATFPEKEMREIRDKLLGAVKEARDDPATLAELHFLNMLYGDNHPAGRPMTAESVARITREDLVRFYSGHYLPGGAILGISGDLDPKQVERKVKRVFGPWPRGRALPRAVQPVQQPAKGLRLLLVDKPDLSQAFFALGHAGVRRGHPQRDAVTVMNYVLGGGGFSSRLMKVVRAEGGKTYGISSRFDMDQEDGAFLVRSFTRNDQLWSMLDLVRSELSRLHRSPPTGEEIDAAKGNIAGGYAVRLQTSADITRRLIEAQLWGFPDSFVTELPVRIGRLTNQEVVGAGREHVLPDHLVVAVVGKASVVAPQLRAAKVGFQQISYLDPISAGERGGGEQGR